MNKEVAVSGWLTLARDAAALSGLLGAFLSCVFNIIVFEDWNINYFQIASIDDILVSALGMGFYVLFLVIPVAIIAAYAIWIRSLFDGIAISVAKFATEKYGIRTFVQKYVYSVLFSILLFSVMLIVFQFAPESWGGSRLGFDIFPQLIAVSFLMAFLVMRLRAVESKLTIEFIMVSIFYFMMWFANFASPSQYRWFGFLTSNHAPMNSLKIEGCDHLFMMWSGEKSSIIECWVDADKKRQRLFIQSNTSGTMTGPIFADAAPAVTASRDGPFPPPFDRMSKEDLQKFQPK